MSKTTILKNGESVLLWIYNRITIKFTRLFKQLKNSFPVLNRFPLLKYSLIPLLIALFFLLRYIIKLGVNEVAGWSSGLVGEASGINVSERAIVFSIIAAVILLRAGFRYRSHKKNKKKDTHLNDEKSE